MTPVTERTGPCSGTAAVTGGFLGDPSILSTKERTAGHGVASVEPCLRNGVFAAGGAAGPAEVAWELSFRLGIRFMGLSVCP